MSQANDDDVGLLSNGAVSSSGLSISVSPLSLSRKKSSWYRVHVSSRVQFLVMRLNPVAGLLFCALAQVFFSMMSLSAKLLGRRLSTAQIVFVRAIIQLFITDSLSLWYGVPIWGPKDRRAFLLGRGAAGGMSLTGYYYSLKALPLGDAVGLSMAQPIWVSILAFVVLKEPMGWKETVMILVCFCGMLLISKPSFLVPNTEPLSLRGILAASIAAMLSAVAYVLVRLAGPTVSHMTLVHYFSVFSLCASVPAHFIIGDSAFALPVGTEWVLVAGVGLFGSIGQLLLNKGLQMDQAGRGASMGYLSIAFAYVYGFLFFDEIPHWSGLVGIALIVAASACILVLQIRARRLLKEREAASARVAAGLHLELHSTSVTADTCNDAAAITEKSSE
jgi:drug/metabolite transporter (DMT)-like permease